jgi:hypothetical protein
MPCSESASDKRKELLKAELLRLGYPWPRVLKSKSIEWIERERRLLSPVDRGSAKQGE